MVHQNVAHIILKYASPKSATPNGKVCLTKIYHT